MSDAATERRVKAFIAKFDVANQRLINGVRRALRRRLPTAFELVYDNYNFFVIAFGATARPSDAILSIAAGASGVGLCFLHGAGLPDPDRVLLGSGNRTRFVRVPSVQVLSEPAVATLIDEAVARSRAPFPSARGQLVIRSVSAKQRPRRKAPRVAGAARKAASNPRRTASRRKPR